MSISKKYVSQEMLRPSFFIYSGNVALGLPLVVKALKRQD